MQASLAGFAEAHDEARAALAAEGANAAGHAPEPTGAGQSALPAPPQPLGPLAQVQALGEARLRDYQDAAYAARYAQRLARLRAAAPDPDVAEPVLAEAARHLALWMAYEDVVRVADLKTRPERLARVRAEAQAADGDVVEIREHLKPGLEELAAIAPVRIGHWLRARARRPGAAPSRPLTLHTTSVRGFVLLKLLAALKRWRPASLRFAEEQQAMDQWLQALAQALPRHTGFALALAGLPRLRKGYGDTFERGRAAFDRISAACVAPALAPGQALGEPQAQALRQAIAAALADPEHQALDQRIGPPPTRPTATAAARSPCTPGFPGGSGPTRRADDPACLISTPPPPTGDTPMNASTPRALAAAAALLLAAGASLAQDKPVELKLAHWVPANHALAVTGFIPWAKSVEAASGGSIKVAIFPAQQLGKAADHYDMARDGITQMAYVNPGYQAGRFPLIAAGELPFMMDKPGPASAALDAWYRGAYAEKEMKDVKVCLAHLHVGTIHSKTAITDPAQIKGMKIRPANGTVGGFMSQLGATNVQVSAPEARDALSKGVADAITFPWNSIVSFGIDKAVSFHTDMRLYAAVFVWALNKPFYDGLSALAKRRSSTDHCNNDWAATRRQGLGR